LSLSAGRHFLIADAVAVSADGLFLCGHKREELNTLQRRQLEDGQGFFCQVNLSFSETCAFLTLQLR
jgi:hypothetical protein